MSPWFVAVVGLLAIVALVSGKVAQDRVGAILWGVLFTFILFGRGEETAAKLVSLFVDPAVITIAALFVMGHAVQVSGAMNKLGYWLVGKGEWRERGKRGRIILFFLLLALLSALINNTAVVIIFIPVGLELARRSGISASRLLIPISYAAILGGTMTLIGTSTNLLVAQRFLEATGDRISLFAFLIPGGAVAVAGGLWLAFVGRHSLPDKKVREDLVSDYALAQFIVVVRINGGSSLAGKTIEEAHLWEEEDLHIVELHSPEHQVDLAPRAGSILGVGDELMLRVRPEACPDLCRRFGLSIVPLSEELQMAQKEGLHLGQALVVPGSDLIGKTIRELSFRGRFGITALAIRHGSEPRTGKMGPYRLQVGDVLLVHGQKDVLEALSQPRSDLLVIQKVPFGFGSRRHAAVAVTLLSLFVGMVALGIPHHFAALIGVGGMILLNTVRVDEAFQAIDHQVLALLIGFMAWGLVMEDVGVFSILVEAVRPSLLVMGPALSLFAVYFLVALLTSFLSNGATAIAFLPLAISIAAALDVNPLPFAMAVALASSASFATPIGYQTNTMVWSLGRYSFADFARIGIPMTVVTGVAACWALLKVYPLTPLS